MHPQLSNALIYENAFSRAAIGMALLDLRGHWLRVNDAAVGILGHAREHLLATDIATITVLEDVTEQSARMEQLLADTCSAFEIDTRIRRPDGSVAWVRLGMSLLRDAAGEAQLFVAQLFNTSGQHQAVQQARNALADHVSQRAAALESARQMLDLHVNNSPLAVIEWDNQHRVTRWSPRAVELFGWTEADVLGKRIDEWHFVVADDKAHVTEAVRQLLSHEVPRSISSNRNHTKSGEIVHCEWSNSALFEPDGSVISFLSLTQDVTARETALAAMRDSEQRFRSTFDQAAVGIAHVGLDGRYTHVNQTLCRFLGYSQAELLPLTFHELTHADDLDADLSLLQQLLDGAINHYGVEKRYCRKDGEVVWGMLTVSLRRDDTGEPLYFISVVEDIGTRKIAEAALQRAHDELEERVALRTSELESANGALAAEVDQRRQAEVALRHSEDHIRSILENSHDAFVAFDETGAIREWNRSAEAVFGWRRSEALGHELAGLILPERDRAGHRLSLARQFDANARDRLGQRLQLTAVRSSGREIPVELTITAVDGGQQRLFTAFVQDISVRVAAQAQLQTSEARLRMVTDNVPALIAYIDRDLRYRFNNEAYRSWYGFDPAALAGRTLREVFGEATFAELQPHLLRALTGERVSFEREELLGSGTRHSLTDCIADFGENGQVQGIYVMAHDVSAHKQLASVLEKRALRDELTGLPNRAAWADQFERGLARAQRSGAPAVVMFLDLDGFKQINDVHGHEAGDALLREFAKRLSGCVRKSDTVARLAGDEFVVLLEDVNDVAIDPAAIAGKILAAMQPALEFRGQPLQLSASIGVAVQRGGELDGEHLMRRADEAMYAAKRNGASRFELIEL